MTLNGNSKTVMGIILSVVVTIFIMLFSGMNGSVKEVQAVNRESSERIVAVETRVEGLVDKIDMIYIDQKEIKGDIKEILQALR
ncbi:hypothetical protein LCGC14_2295320 [marine sediment metagenome]|uniref:Uncharacterized protein n=1 Tax=marine sediment metagenome TaxID=412755 RepID=A0A0F9CQJ3_9ZZZZ